MFEYIFLRLLHGVLTFGVIIKQCAAYFIHYGLVFKQKSSIDLIKSDARHLKKLPIHLGIIVFEETYSYTDIANIIIWSLALGISYITVYDVNGDIKRNQSLLQEEVIKKQKEILKEDSTKYSICLLSSREQRSNIDNGYSCGNRVDVQLLSAKDGRQGLVELTQKLSMAVSSNNYKLDDINPHNVDNLLQETNKFPDPDLVIKFGAVDSLLGFLPWHIRLTEILTYPTHCGITYKSFIWLFNSYGKTQQRFGR